MMRILWASLPWLLVFAPRPVSPEEVSLLGSCRCDCCETQELAVKDGNDGLQCALILGDEQQEGGRFMSPNRASGHQVCGELCKRDVNDPVLTAAESDQLDFERFCFYECQPSSSQPGAPCTRIKETDRLVKDASGNARAPGFAAPPPAPPMLALPPPPMTYALQGGGSTAGSRVGAPWDATKDSANIGARAEKVAMDAKEEGDAATANANQVNNIMTQNQGVMPAVLSNTEVARDAARVAHKQEVYLTELAEEMRAGAQQAARDMIKDTLKDLKKSSRAAAKAEGEKKAKKLWEKMKAMAPKAAAKAGVPYFAALGRAMKMAGEYQKRADAMVGMSISMQMDAQMTLGGAQAFMALGDTPKAQKMFQTAHVTMNMATGLNGAANGFYDAARSIMGTLGAYVGESLQAGYHDAVLWNPDYPPPPPALVFAQESAKTVTVKQHDAVPPAVPAMGAVMAPPAPSAPNGLGGVSEEGGAAAAAAAAAAANAASRAPRSAALR